MMIISFASKSHRQQQTCWAHDLKSRSIPHRCYTEDDIDSEYMKHKYGKRGFGFWFWKPYIIEKALQEYPSVFYMDVDYRLISVASLENLINTRGNPNMTLFRYDFENEIWCKRDTFILMNCDSVAYWQGDHLEAGLSYWTPEAIKLIIEWKTFCKHPQIISDDTSIIASERPAFKDHRHDQAILSLLRIKYNIKALSIHRLRNIIEGSDI